jgi:hypothetical protein
MNQLETPTSEIKDLTPILVQAIIARGFYNPYDVFHHEPYITKEPEGSKYQYKAMIVKWNTKSSRATNVGLKFDDKLQKWVVSTYKQNSLRRYSHGEKMR